MIRKRLTTLEEKKKALKCQRFFSNIHRAEEALVSVPLAQKCRGKYDATRLISTLVLRGTSVYNMKLLLKCLE